MSDEKKDVDLFSPLKIGKLELPNRFVMAPLTRSRADKEPRNKPNALMNEYYTQRASAGLIISEFTTIAEKAVTFYLEAGIWSKEQVEAWAEITASVHKAGGRIFCQIAHGGRAANSLNNDGEVPVAPSAIQISSHTGENFNPTGKKVDNSMPRALTDEEAGAIVDQFAVAAKNAVAAGFDGVEVHGANGYLIDQFLRQSANKRTEGRYSGEKPETRIQFLKDVLEAVTKAIGSDRVGLRISPLNSFQDMKEDDPIALVERVAEVANEFDLAYLHVMRADFFQAQTGDVLTPARKFKGALISNMGYQPDEANAAIKEGKVDAIAFGTLLLANPDLVERVKAGAELNKPDPSTFYTRGPKGYTDYPFMKK